MRLLHITFALLLSTLLLSASKITDGEYHSVKAKGGDGVDILLQRYGLLTDPSLKTAFFDLNKLGKKGYLYTGKRYTLPVLLYNYNGKSIRSTVGNDSWETALAIQKYNESLLARGIRSTDFRDSKILWVPLHLANGQVGKEPKVITKKKRDPLLADHTLDIYGSGNGIKKLTDNRCA